jgi:hypothetical protein
MICAIMQPTYMPWAGYFNLIHNSDVFVFLDDVQLDHHSWQTRNRVLSHSQEILLSVPIKKHYPNTLIYDTEVVTDQRWRSKHAKTIKHAYGKSPFFSEVYPLYENILYDTSVKRLLDLNIHLIKIFSEKLNIKSKFFLASELNCPGVRSEHLYQICKKLNADLYISPKGAQDYIEEGNDLIDSNIKVIYQNYNIQPYSQFGSKKFMSHMSVIDVIMSLGCDLARNYVVDGWEIK